jgi:dTDP-4-dehydrorhamnose 3,5-epimerase
MNYSFKPLPIQGAFLAQGEMIADARGSFERVIDFQSISAATLNQPISQVNRSLTRLTGTVRGMHCQLPPHSEVKVVTCVSGSAFDVMVDLRFASPTFGQWWGHHLNGSQNAAIVIPVGCAHGLQTTSPDTQILYFHTAPYAPDFEAGINPLDRNLAIDWPVPISEISLRDKSEERGIEWFRQIQW